MRDGTGLTGREVGGGRGNCTKGEYPPSPQNKNISDDPVKRKRAFAVNLN
jgi:hypothetical protein